MEKQEDTIVFFTSPPHLHPTIALAKFIKSHHPTLPITIISFSAAPSAVKSAAAAGISYVDLPPVPLPPTITKNHIELFFEVPRLQQPNLVKTLAQISEKSNIKAFVIDFFCNSAFEVSRTLNIPTYFDASVGAGAVCAFMYHLTIHNTTDTDIADWSDFVEIPGCPLIHRLDYPTSMLRRKSGVYAKFVDVSINMRKSSGILVNSFDSLEFRAKTALKNGLCVPEGPTPPVYLVSPTVAEVVAIGERVKERQHECLSWLDSQPSKSVVFLCFGSKGAFSVKQLREIALGLEKSGVRFLWAVRGLVEKGGNTNAEELKLSALLPEGFLDRTKGVGFVVENWAPQREVLGHEAIGGFVTHCGWNSVLEAVSFGVPMIGWPLYAEQRMNKVFIVEEIKVALAMVEGEGGFVKSEEVESRVRELMVEEKGEGVRRRVEELKVSARAAVSEGGSALVALEEFVGAVCG